MNAWLIESFGEYLKIQLSYEDDDVSKIKYSFETILLEIEKIIILFILFLILGKGHEYIVTSIVLFTIRPFSGGLHLKTFSSCLVFTFTFYLLALVLLPLIDISQTQVITILTISLMVNILLAPVSSPKRPTRNKKTNIKYKTISSTLIVLHSLTIIFVLKDANIIDSYVWIIALQSAQLIISKEMYKNEKKPN